MPIYMKFEGIEGSATGKYKGWIPLESCQLGAQRNTGGVTGAGRESSAPSVSEIVVTKFTDNASTHLFSQALQGSGKKVTIDFVPNGGDAPYLSVELENVLISSFNVGGGSDKPMESLSLNFTKVTYTTKATSTPPDAKSTNAKVTWDSVVK